MCRCGEHTLLAAVIPYAACSVFGLRAGCNWADHSTRAPKFMEEENCLLHKHYSVKLRAPPETVKAHFRRDTWVTSSNTENPGVET